MLITLRSMASKQLLAIAVEAEATHGISGMVVSQLRTALRETKTSDSDSDTSSSLSSSLRGSNKDGPVGMTPLEVDVQLQAAELVFRSLLEGKRPGICSLDVDEWLSEVCGSDWADKNKAQRAVVSQQMRDEGYNTPMWIEAFGHTSDIGWEMFESRGATGERVRTLAKIDRTEVLEQIRELLPKVRASHYARCGAGDRRSGLRALVAVFHVFARDPEMLDAAARCLTLIITGNDMNRDSLAEVFVAMPPAERREHDRQMGWSFLRAALNAFMVQANAETQFPSQATAQAEEADEDQEEIIVHREPDPKVAVLIAECLAAAATAPAMRVQLRLLNQEPSASSPLERRELTEMVEPVRLQVEEMMKEDSSPALRGLLDMMNMVTHAEFQD